MKILHVGYSDSKGGAAIAMMRLHKSLVDINVDSKVLVAQKITNDPDVIGPNKSLEIIVNDIKLILVIMISSKIPDTSLAQKIGICVYRFPRISRNSEIAEQERLRALA